MTFDEIYQRVEKLPGWMGEEDCRVLYKYAQLSTGLIVEIGSYGGRSTLMLALGSGRKVISIDPYIGYEDIYKGFQKTIKGLDIELIKKKSEDAAQTWNKKIGLLHVDGDHHYEEVKKDIKFWAPHVQGSILFHDYVVHQEDFGVEKAVNEMFKNVHVEAGFAVIHL